MAVYEFAAPVLVHPDEEFSSPGQLLGTIRYGISTIQMETARAEAKVFSQQVMMITLLILFMLGFIAIVLAFIATRHTATLISKPLADLSKSTVDIARGHYDSPVAIDSDNEIGLLSRNFDSMRIKIKNVLEQLLLSEEDLKEKNKRLEITQGELKDFNLHLEDKVKERTDELAAVQKKLLDTARAAGMAEIAINVLHNIGNVINSVNVANQDNYIRLKSSKVTSLIKTNELLNENRASIADYLSQDPKGQKIPDLLEKLAVVLNKENQILLENTHRMMQSIGIIGNIISTQQKYARSNLFKEDFNLKSVIEESLNIMTINLNKHLIKIKTDFKPVPFISGDQSKFHQVLANLLVNAQHALLDNTPDNRFVDIKLFCEQHFIVLQIRDNGEGISQQSLTNIFQHGFTTKKNGHGFGLHSCANIIAEMGGSIEANSDGPGKGACFTIKLPIKNQ
ncbi:MAG: HAMP domain-containing protein [gamma proteobacterium symbiont of Bathyaustriella thionipta]|nr:HAMP domain-containing protein [gamma proteobacterium symbiont of Bathyaustriella thionipta]MCU7949797.1 HAMP domain-containing protein [gamma proteobacterium symbiont of Bathyaustriella thionipta]MCU7954234.1 HAMP domain-containing protein [gamma proteobacterium symbiont of Bathyaustriella thionipta]MCU7956391.1 HAMP domain-containing protein [gamma proteobacterium symbiont of Bathyaustriella thionipta]MCU7968515.1 HAMP domain-containing protein [gamma proteobacterium symbiont of Bathyaustr